MHTVRSSLAIIVDQNASVLYSKVALFYKLPLIEFTSYDSWILYYICIYDAAITSAIANCAYWVVLTLSNQVTPLILGSPLGLFGFLYIVTGVNVFAFFLVLLALPETKVSP